MKRVEVLEMLQAALAPLNVPALVSRAEWPEGADQVIVADVISSRKFGYDQDYAHQIQTSAYAPTLEQAEDLSDASIEALEAAGFISGISRPAPSDDDALFGVITDWRLT